jgi:hypothetical protein
MTLIARTLTQPELWADTSETLTLTQYRALAQKGYRGCCRYLPLAGDSGGIAAAELAAALSVTCPDGSGFSLMFVQFSRSSPINAAEGAADGQAAALALRALGVPPTVSVWQDLSPASAAACIAYSNAWTAAALAAGVAEQAPGMYAEPGYPLTAEQRYQELNVQRYWATAANDPEKMVASRGCQILQLWGSSQGEFALVPGLEIDADAVQADYFGSWPVAVVAG